MEKLLGTFRFISTVGLGWEGDMQVYQDADGMYVYSLMSGARVPVQWIVEDETVGYIV